MTMTFMCGAAHRPTHRSMARRIMPALVFALSVSGCAFVDVFDRDNTAPVSAPPKAQTESRTSSSLRPLQGSDSAIAADITEAQQNLSAALARGAVDVARVTTLSASSERKAEEYYGTISAIEERLRLGAPPSSAVLIQQWNEAQGALDQIAWDINGLDRVSVNLTAHDATLASGEQQLRGYEQASAATQVDQQNVRQLLEDTAAARSDYRRMQEKILDDMRRYARLLKDERPHLAQVQNQIIGGSASLAGDVMASPRTTLRTPDPDNVSEEVTLPPLVVIRFDRPNVAYEAQLQSAIRQALAIDPEMQFRVIAVSPDIRTFDTRLRAQAQATQFAQSVMRSMTRMGVTEEAMLLEYEESGTARSSEVHIRIQD